MVVVNYNHWKLREGAADPNDDNSKKVIYSIFIVENSGVGNIIGPG